MFLVPQVVYVPYTPYPHGLARAPRLITVTPTGGAGQFIAYPTTVVGYTLVPVTPGGPACPAPAPAVAPAAPVAPVLTPAPVLPDVPAPPGVVPTAGITKDSDDAIRRLVDVQRQSQDWGSTQSADR